MWLECMCRWVDRKAETPYCTIQKQASISFKQSLVLVTVQFSSVWHMVSSSWWSKYFCYMGFYWIAESKDWQETPGARVGGITNIPSWNQSVEATVTWQTSQITGPPAWDSWHRFWNFPTSHHIVSLWITAEVEYHCVSFNKGTDNHRLYVQVFKAREVSLKEVQRSQKVTAWVTGITVATRRKYNKGWQRTPNTEKLC